MAEGIPAKMHLLDGMIAERTVRWPPMPELHFPLYADWAWNAADANIPAEAHTPVRVYELRDVDYNNSTGHRRPLRVHYHERPVQP